MALLHSAASFKIAGWLPSLLIFLLVFTYPHPSVGQTNSSATEPKAGSSSRFLRFLDGSEQWQGQLQTSISSYTNKSGITLNLVSAVHMADASYYAALNNYFRTQDAVLYELVADSDKRPAFSELAVDQGAVSPVSMIQRGMANFLQLSFQLEKIDYTQPNFRHADVSPAQLSEIMQSKNENSFSMMLSLALAQSLSQAQHSSQSGLGSLSMLRALMTNKREAATKYFLAQELSNSELSSLTAEVEAQLTILGDRNRAALSVLKTSLKDSQLSQLSLFYGAAHMPGLERAIINEFGFEKVSEQWLNAWIIP